MAQNDTNKSIMCGFELTPYLVLIRSGYIFKAFPIFDA